MYIPW